MLPVFGKGAVQGLALSRVPFFDDIGCYAPWREIVAVDGNNSILGVGSRLQVVTDELTLGDNRVPDNDFLVTIAPFHE